MMIGSTTCEQEIKNTINTVLSYESISQKRSKSVSAVYIENGKDGTMSQVDAVAKIQMLLLAAVWSGENHGLDSKDLDNFLNYERISKYPAGLVGLKIYDAKVQAELQKGQAVASVVSLVRQGEDPSPGIMVGSHTYGVISEAASDAIRMATPIHLHTVAGYFATIVNELKTKLQEAEELYRVNPVNTLKIDMAVQDDGLVL